MRNILPVLGIVALCLVRSSGQSDELEFYKFPDDMALSHSPVTAILQDYKGFIWLGTWSGLMQFDGYETREFRQQPDNTNGLESNKITTLFEDSKQRLWVGTHNSGLYLYDRVRDYFVKYDRDPADMNSLSNNNVWSIYEDCYGMFWIGTQGGLNYFNPDTERFIHFSNAPDDVRSLSNDFVYSICEGSDSSLWIATEQGLNRLVRRPDHEPDYMVRYSLGPEPYEPAGNMATSHNYIYKVRPVKNEPMALWAGTKEGLKKVTYSPGQMESMSVADFTYDPADPASLSHDFVVDMWEDNTDRLWVATFNGLNLREAGTAGFIRFIVDEAHPDIFYSNVMKALYQDRSNVLWIGTEGGLHKLDLAAKPFTTLRPGGKSITSIIQSTEPSIFWVGTRGGGIFGVSRQDGYAHWKPVQYKVNAGADVAGFVSDIVLDRSGTIWATTLGAGLISFNERDAIAGLEPDVAQRSISHNLKLIGEEHLMTLVESGPDVLWIGTWDDGVIRYDKKNDQFKAFPTTSDFGTSLAAFPVVHLFVEENEINDIIWVCTRGNGLLKLRFNKTNAVLDLVQHYTSDTSLANALGSNFINCLFEDSSGRLWVGTENGLNLFDPVSNGFLKPGGKTEGMNTTIVQAIREDALGRLWVSSQAGILCISGNFLSDSLIIQAFDVHDGLQDNFFYDNSACTLADGMVAFGGARGLNLFEPEKIHPDPIAPQVAITDFRLFNKSVGIGQEINGRILLDRSIANVEEISLTHRDHVVSFEFVGLQFRQPRKTQYAYKLEGFDPDWVYTDATRRTAHYTNLPYDEFQFMVKAANGDGVWSDPVSVQLSVSPPFWQTSGAYVLYALFVAGLIFIAYRVARMRANLQHSLQVAHLEREKMEEVNRMKLNFFTNLSHELRTPLTLILSPLEQLLTEPEASTNRHSTYVGMRNNANRLLTMINQLLDFRKSEAGLVQMHVAPHDFIEFVGEIVASFKGFARQRNLSLGFHSDTRHFTLWYDHDWMEKVVFNLLSNALKFTQEGGEVTVEVICGSNKSVKLVVRDTGPGIKEEELARIFDRFYQGSRQSNTHHDSGTGIGLALSKFVIDAHHGAIFASNLVEGGAEFCIELLHGAEHFSDDEKAPVIVPKNPSVFKLTSASEKATPDNIVAGETETAKPDKKHPLVLLVDDNAEIRKFLRENLEHEYRIEEAENGQVGLDIAMEITPDLIVADISMPGMDGIDMCAALKTNIITSHIPVVVLTARTSMTFRLGSLETGADDYITKPFNMQLVRLRIRNLIESRRTLREKYAKSIDLSPGNLVINSLDEEFIDRVKKVIERHIDDSTFTVENLAKEMLMSRMQLYRKLKSLTGKSPNKVIRGMRLKRAAQLLETLQYNVSDVTYMVGYSDLKSFREQFKKEFGVSPSEYEQKN